MVRKVLLQFLLISLKLLALINSQKHSLIDRFNAKTNEWRITY